MGQVLALLSGSAMFQALCTRFLVISRLVFSPSMLRFAQLAWLSTRVWPMCGLPQPYVGPHSAVDGVVVGNYRCSLAGLDLNRVWQEPDGRLQPAIAAFKDMIKAFMNEREVG